MSHAGKTFWTLIQREMWEHRGAFLYTPLIVAAVLVVLVLMSAGSMSFWQLKVDGAESMTEGALKLAETQIPAAQLEAGVTGSLWGTAILWQSITFIVLMVFCIGSLYDDRRDRSVLFWKSMPVSDLQTVISKLAMALIVAPLLMLAGMIVGQLLLLLVTGIILMAHGGSAWKLIWSHAHPLSVWGQFLVVQGVQAFYLLPLYGWLMLAGAFARGKPYLWAILPPVAFAIIESFIGFTANFSISKVIWEFILRRLASGFAPISFSANFGDHGVQSGFSGTRFAANFSDVMARMGSADLWIGVAIGVAFLAAAVYLRRYRDESTS